MDDATYYAWRDRLNAATTVEALDAVVHELEATIGERDGDHDDLIHMAAPQRVVLVTLEH